MKVIFYAIQFFLLIIMPAYAQTYERVEDSLSNIIKRNGTPDSVIAKAYLQLISKGAFYKSKDSLYIQKAESFFGTLPLNIWKLQFGVAKMDCAKRNENYNEQIALCNDNIKMAEALQDTAMLAKLLSAKAYTFVMYGNGRKGVELQKKAIIYSDKKIASPIERASNYFLAGWFIFNVAETDSEKYKSLGYFKQAYKLIKDYPKDEELYVKMEYSGWISNAYSAGKDYENAILHRHKAIEYIHMDHDNPFQLGDSYRYLASVYTNMKNYDSAIVYFGKALTLFLSIEEPGRSCIVSSSMANVYLRLKEPQKAKQVIEMVIYNPKFMNDMYYNEFFLKVAAKVYDKNGDHKISSMLYGKYVRYSDSISKINEKNTIAELDLKADLDNTQLRYEFEQNKKEEIFVKEQQRQLVIRNALIIGGCLGLLLIFVLYRSNISKKKDNILLQNQKNEIEYQKKEMQDSINYARNIQNALLPNESLIQKSFHDYFILYKPKDIISGDFYWFHKTQDPTATHPVFIAAADCTGHGVPGAFMSMLGADSLDNSILEKHIYNVGEALSTVNQKIKGTLGQSEEGVAIRDGMDIALCAFKTDLSELQYAGAHRPLYIIRKSELIEHKATKQSIGGFTDNNQEFIKHDIKLEKGDMVYITSDGYADQFGGEKGKKYTTSRFKDLLKSTALHNGADQKNILDKTIETWRGHAEQLDDILIIGIRI